MMSFRDFYQDTRGHWANRDMVSVTDAFADWLDQVVTPIIDSFVIDGDVEQMNDASDLTNVAALARLQACVAELSPGPSKDHVCDRAVRLLRESKAREAVVRQRLRAIVMRAYAHHENRETKIDDVLIGAIVDELMKVSILSGV